MSKTKKRYYISFGGDLMLSQEGKDKRVRKATERDKKKYGGTIGDIITDLAETVGSQFTDFKARRVGHSDFRKGGMVVNTVDNRKRK